jgi:hypothetical protein
MRHVPERTSGHSPTPIYDTLYAEYRMTFRTLPGDRSGEEDLRFKAFAAFTGFATGLHGTGLLQAVTGAGAGLPGPRGDARQLPGPSHAGHPAHPAPGTNTTPVAHPAHPTVPHQTDRPGGYQTGTWRHGRKQHGPADLLPAVLPHRPRDDR